MKRIPSYWPVQMNFCYSCLNIGQGWLCIIAFYCLIPYSSTPLSISGFSSKIMEEHHLPAPKTLIVNNPLRYRTILRDIPFPCVIKPVFGYQFRRHLNRKVIVIEDLNQLRKDLAHYSLFGELLIQEIVPGPDEAIYQVGALYDEGDSSELPSWGEHSINTRPSMAHVR